jgi:DNA adenine methylase
LATIERRLPKHFNRYFEPFLGGGAVFFRLLPERALLSDINEELINCYRVVRDDVESLVEELRRHRNDRHHFYRIRAQNVATLSDVQRAARLIFLNKTCFNGLYRVNSKGQFNVPFGRYKNPRICDAANLLAVSRVLCSASMVCAPFEVALIEAGKGDFVYLDPPYQPISATSKFTGYTRGAFGYEDQVRLAATFKDLHKRGCLLMLSNSDSPVVRDLYADFQAEVVHATRAINCKADRRGRIRELLIVNY